MTNFPTREELIRSGYSKAEADNILSNPYAALIFGCELPGEAPQCRGDLVKGWTD